MPVLKAEYVKGKNGDYVSPITSEHTVKLDDGKTLKYKLDELNNKIGDISTVLSTMVLGI